MPKDTFESALLAARIEKRSGVLHGGWDPFQVKTRQDMAQQITRANEPGNSNHFWGEDITLCALSRVLDLDIYVFEIGRDGFPSIFLVSRLSTTDTTASLLPRLSIWLWYDRAGVHYQTLGLRKIVNGQSGYQTLFYTNELPRDFKVWLARKTKS